MKRKWLEEAVRRIRGYCHVEECEKVNECPTTHVECKKKLGLDTAIAWKVAECLLSDDWRGFYLLLSVVELYREEYPDLANVLGIR